jgi:hypothetical protein
MTPVTRAIGRTPVLCTDDAMALAIRMHVHSAKIALKASMPQATGSHCPSGLPSHSGLRAGRRPYLLHSQ